MNSINIDELKKYGKVKIYPVNSTIFTEGEYGDNMFFIIEGKVKIVKEGTILSTLSVGDICGEMALLENLPRTATAISDSDCLVFEFKSSEYEIVCEKIPEIATRITRMLCERIRKQNDMIVDLNWKLHAKVL